MIHLIGVDHSVQHKKCTAAHHSSPAKKANWKSYSSIVGKAICEFQPEVVAEELNQELLDQRYNRSESLLVFIKNNFELQLGRKIDHIFLEPCSVEKYRRGIGPELPFSNNAPDTVVLSPPDGFHNLSDLEWHQHNIAHRFPIREEYWIAKLGDDIYKTVLLVCGAVHICTFKERLESRDIEVNVVADSIGCLATMRDSDEFKALEEVRRNGFPPVTIGADPRCFCVRPETGVTGDDQQSD